MSDVTFKDNSQKVFSSLKKAKQNALEAIGMSAESHAKKVITKAKRVDTGRMRDDVSHAVKGSSVYVGTNVEYAPYQELGTVKITGIHFLQRAATEHSAEYKRLMKEALESQSDV